jgi:hypothetical protein
MNTTNLFIMILAIVTINFIIGIFPSAVEAQTPTGSDLPMTTINETNSTVAVFNKTLSSENGTEAVPLVPNK